MNQQERMEFVRSHRTAIFGYNRRNDGPSMSVVYYVLDGDDILVSTMAERGKAKVVRRNPKISLCVLDEKWPLTYLQVYCDATIETDLEGSHRPDDENRGRDGRQSDARLGAAHDQARCDRRAARGVASQAVPDFRDAAAPRQHSQGRRNSHSQPGRINALEVTRRAPKS